MNSQPSPAWTPSAEADLEAWFARRLHADLLEGADPAEVRADLTMHLHEELAAAGVGTVTSEILAAALAKMGGPAPARTVLPAPRDAGAPAVAPAGLVKVRTAFRYPAWFLFLAVILPLLAWFIETTTHWCASIIFDPLPTLWHHLFVLTAIAAAFMGWKTTRAGLPGSIRLLKAASWLTGAGIAAASYYTLLFAPFTPHAFCGIIIWGAGILPLSALASFCSLLRARKSSPAGGSLQKSG